MKKCSLPFIITSLCYFILSTSCNPKQNIIDNAFQYDTIHIDQTYYINNDSTNPGCNILIDFIFPDSVAKNLQKTFVEKMFGPLFKNMNPEQAVEEYVSQYILNFKNFAASFVNQTNADDNIENIYEDETGYSYYIRIKDEILYNKNNFISFTIETLSYEGGAHSSKSIYGYVYNLNTDKLLEESDFAGNNYSKNISSLISEQLAKENRVNKIQELENLGYNSLDDLKPNNNFTLDGKGITYYFNENEIAGTMVGISRVFIPYDELNIYIQKESPISVLTSY